jgi:hypothetical protein
MANDHSIADTTAIADEMNRRPAREPERHTFIWLDHQKYHADDQTIATLWQIKGWDRSPDQAVAHFAFDHAKQQGQVHEGPVSHHEIATRAHAEQEALEGGGDIVRSGMTVEGVRKAFQMEPQDAVARGLVRVEDIGGGELAYRAVPQHEPTLAPGHSL